MTLTVSAELACTDMVKDPVKIPERTVELHAFREYVTGGRKIPAVLTVEIHDPLGSGDKGSVLLHFEADKLLAAIAVALINADS